MVELVLKYRLFIAGTNFTLSGSQQLLQSRHVMMLIRDEQTVKRNSDGIHFTFSDCTFFSNPLLRHSKIGYEKRPLATTVAGARNHGDSTA